MMNEDWYRVVDGLESLDEVYSVAIETKQTKSDCDWVLGELAVKVTSSPDGEKKEKSLKHFAGCVNESYGKVKDAARVVRSVNRNLRGEFPSLEFGHWREIVKRTQDANGIYDWAVEAADKGLTVTALRKLLSDGTESSTDYGKIIKRIIGDMDVVEQNAAAVTQSNAEEFSHARKRAGAFARSGEAGVLVQEGGGSEREHEGVEGEARREHDPG